MEIGGGQSTSLLSKYGQRFGWNIITIDMNPESITLKLRSQIDTEDTLKNISFRKGDSISTDEIRKFYENGFDTIGNIPFELTLKATNDFIEITMDPRRLDKVNGILNIEKFEKNNLIDKILFDKPILPKLNDVYRTEGDELSFHEKNNIEQFNPLLKTIMDNDLLTLFFWMVVNFLLYLNGKL